MRDLAEYKTVHDLAADWDYAEACDVVGFRLHGGSVTWTDAEYTSHTMYRVRIGRIEPTSDGQHLRVFVRYVEPDTRITLVRGSNND